MTVVRIGVWNLECVRSKERNPARVQFLQERNADIWVLTETHDEIDLSESHPHAARSKARIKSANDMHWVGIWSRFPIIETIESSDVRTAIALVDATVGPVLVFGTVWPWQSDTGEYPYDPAWSAWARQPAVIAQQRLQWARLKRDWPNAALCVAGDLNMTFGGPYTYHSREGRLEAALAMQAEDLVCTTAWSRLPQRALNWGPIDHVLLPYDLAIRTRVCDTWPAWDPKDPNKLSDHSGLIVEVAGVSADAV